MPRPALIRSISLAREVLLLGQTLGDELWLEGTLGGSRQGPYAPAQGDVPRKSPYPQYRDRGDSLCVLVRRML